LGLFQKIAGNLSERGVLLGSLMRNHRPFRRRADLPVRRFAALSSAVTFAYFPGAGLEIAATGSLKRLPYTCTAAAPGLIKRL
jgi:hypothetical protein